MIAEQLLFASGDPYSARVLAESERLLREDRYLGEVTIRPLRYDGRRVDVEVVARDVWTLNVGVGVGRAGGAGSTRLQLEDTNFLGTGKEVALLRTTDVDRRTDLFRFRDPSIHGSRFQLDLDWAESDDGNRRAFDFGRPFYSLDSRWAFAVRADSEQRNDSLYRRGEVSDRFGHDRDGFEVSAGRSRGLVEGAGGHGVVRRWSAGFTYRDDRYRELVETTGPLPPERILAFPWVSFDWQLSDWQTTHNLDRMGRTEDLPLGPHLHARLGVSAAAFGAEHDELVFDGVASVGLGTPHQQLLRLDSTLSGRYGLEGGSGGLAGTLLTAGGRYYHRNFGDGERYRGELYVGLSGALARRLDPGEQLLLGGDSGLRGYPLRYQEGTASGLFTLEQRFFTGWYPLRVARVGWAVFYDAGRVWGGPDGQRLGLLQDLGLGLRLSPTRTGRAAVVHLDLAFPLDGPGDIDRVQWLIKTHDTF